MRAPSKEHIGRDKTHGPTPTNGPLMWPGVKRGLSQGGLLSGKGSCLSQASTRVCV